MTFNTTSPVGWYLALGLFIDLTNKDTKSYEVLAIKWTLNPQKTTPENLAAFDMYLANSYFYSFSLFYQPPSYKKNSDTLKEVLNAASGTRIVYS
ncbi:hypothetical protein HMI54_015845 [Coelomomyces lativittatus]|nr:hypothetical protein HMI56_001152 [Coelomomyces lativittatus]KAJ1512217.1 hypothetical protein HMI54_015845 [Coelomomyces lativittatus]KAJ1516715.1 hypothetical protein HMI55_001596 [Coelomomyces lativittatus]